MTIETGTVGVSDKWQNLDEFLADADLDLIEEHIRHHSGDPETAWNDLNRYWDGVDFDITDEGN